MKMNDIRHNISVPEGYFGDLRERLSGIPASVGTGTSSARGWRTSPWPYAALAASMAAIVVAGNFILKTVTPSQVPDSDYNDAFAEIIMEANLPQEYYLAEAEESPSGEDIIEYLIDNGTTAEYLNYAENETDY